MNFYKRIINLKKGNFLSQLSTWVVWQILVICCQPILPWVLPEADKTPLKLELLDINN